MSARPLRPLIVGQNPDIEIVQFTPALATEWLERNTHNRKQRDSRAVMFAADMAAGKWLWTGEPIKVAKDGVILDGQHRLMAIEASGATIPLLVVRNLDYEAQEVMDQVTPRSFADALTLRGEINTTALSSVVRAVGAWEGGSRGAVLAGGGKGPQSIPMLFAVLDRYPELREIATESKRLAPSSGLTPTPFGLCYWMFWNIQSEEADFFFQRLSDGQNMSKGDPIFELRRTLFDAKTNDRKLRHRHVVFVIKAWNAYREGRQVDRYKWASTEGFPEPI